MTTGPIRSSSKDNKYTKVALVVLLVGLVSVASVAYYLQIEFNNLQQVQESLKARFDLQTSLLNVTASRIVGNVSYSNLKWGEQVNLTTFSAPLPGLLVIRGDLLSSSSPAVLTLVESPMISDSFQLQSPSDNGTAVFAIQPGNVTLGLTILYFDCQIPIATACGWAPNAAYVTVSATYYY